ncbi:hypothetical protein ACWEF6_07085 [Amycolatopsis sp. NPDC004772]
MTVAKLPVPIDVGEGVGLGAAQLVLSSGQPAKPWTFTWRFDEPLEPGRRLYLVDDSGNGSAYGISATPREGIDAAVTSARVHVARLSPDRRSGSVDVAHLSFKEWVADAAGDLTHKIGEFFDQRGPEPECKDRNGKVTARPQWLSDAVFVDDVNAPMRVCVGSDPAKSDLVEVDVVNNRGGALLVKVPVDPTWAWTSGLGVAVEDWVPGVMTQLVEYLGVPRGMRRRPGWYCLGSRCISDSPRRSCVKSAAPLRSPVPSRTPQSFSGCSTGSSRM